jgi:hypothetical protein
MTIELDLPEMRDFSVAFGDAIVLRMRPRGQLAGVLIDSFDQFPLALALRR